MRLPHLASLCLPFSCFRNCKPSSTDATAQPTQVAVESFETPISTALDPTSIYYLEAHGYYVWDIDVSDVGFKLYSPLYGNGIQDPVLHIDLDIDHKVNTIFDNNLKHEKPGAGPDFSWPLL
ncbi:hypothetical protein Cpir12675_004697 [Ceratocystis pirilliformis]|uniref:Uncharacterized protein n=1 Tax=Ceratocystis pirilliformis TaxID=259994 RepID=A0ABR3YVX7_9PEZI